MSTFLSSCVKIEFMVGDFEWLKPELRKRGLSGRKLAEKIGRSPANTAKIINGQVTPGVDFYQDIAKALRLPLSVVLSRSGIIPPIDPETSEIITILGKLDPDTKKEVLEFAKFKEQTQKTP